jgi:class 3 adenylate cyclase/tetratricopeptide (TPR) repeat protein
MSVFGERYVPAGSVEAPDGELIDAIDSFHARPVALLVRAAAAGASRNGLAAQTRALMSLPPHPNVSTVRDAFFAGDRYVVVMDRAEGQTLAALLASQGQPGLPVSAVLGYLEQLATAVDHLHRQQPPVVHGDVRPEQVMISAAGAVLLMLAGTTSWDGTAGEVTRNVAVDVAGFAATAVQLLTGSRPAAASDAAADAPMWAGVDPDAAKHLGRILRRALDPDAVPGPGPPGVLVERMRAWQSADLPAGAVTFLLTDIEGSTALWEAHPQVMASVIARHHEIVADCVEAHDGRQPRSQGEGDSTLSVFARPTDAVAAALAVQRALRDEPWAEGIQLRVRAGLHTGEAEVRGGDYFGAAVSRTARIRALARGSEVLLSQATAQLAMDRLPAGAGLGHVGRRALKGLSREEEIYQLRAPGLVDTPLPAPDAGTTWMPGDADGGAAAGVPLPARLGMRPPTGVVGRQAEISTIAAARRRVADGEGCEALLISGEAGLGKTTLAAEAARAAFGEGCCVLFGHCEEDLATPYQLFAEALTHFVTHADERQLYACADQHGAELTRLVPALAGRLPGLPPSKATDPDTERYLLFAAVVGVLAALSRAQPVVLVLDDLQWADEGSLLMLRHLAAAGQVTRVLILGTYRDAGLAGSHPLTDALAALHRQGRLSRIELAGLDDAGVVALLEAAAGYTLDDTGVSLARAVHRETDGNPFFVSEVLRHLSETGAIYRDAAGRWAAAGALEQMALPESVRVVIGARVGRLGPDAARALSVAAVIGRDFDLDLLAVATKTSEDELLDVLDAAAAVTLVRELPDPAGRYSFAHSLIQHTLYEDLGPTRRARAHRRVAEALEELCGDHPGARVGELARHWSNAPQPGGLAQAIRYSRAAADAALEALAPQDALRYYAQALALSGRVADLDPILSLDLTIGLGTAQRQTGDPAYRGTLLGAARRAAELGQTDCLVRAALASDRGFFSTVGTTNAANIEVLETALASLPGDHPDRALVLALLCQELTHGSPLGRRIALAEEALTIAKASDHDAVIVRVLNLIALPLRVPAQLEQSLVRTADALARAERLGDPVQLFWALGRRASIAAWAGDIDEMDRCLERDRLLADQIDQPGLRWVVSNELVARALLAGDIERAERLAAEAFKIGTDAGEPDAGLYFNGEVLGICARRGTLGDIAELIAQTARENPGLPALVGNLARAYVQAGKIDDARRLLHEFARSGFDPPLDYLWLVGMAGWAEVAIACGDPEYAGPIFDRLAPWADQLTYIDLATEGPVSLYLGGLAAVLGRHGEAEAYFAKSADFCERAAARCFAAQTDLWWGAMLAERGAPGDVERAGELLSRAHASAVAHGYGSIERDAAGALRRR